MEPTLPARDRARSWRHCKALKSEYILSCWGKCIFVMVKSGDSFYTQHRAKMHTTQMMVQGFKDLYQDQRQNVLMAELHFSEPLQR